MVGTCDEQIAWIVRFMTWPPCLASAPSVGDPATEEYCLRWPYSGR